MSHLCHQFSPKKGKLTDFAFARVAPHLNGPVPHDSVVLPAILPQNPAQKELSMNRKELLQLLLNQAQFNGFDFREWFQMHVQATWPGTEQALNLLASESRYYALLFSHEFAQSYWRSGARISFV